jgi:hypothetical protein
MTAGTADQTAAHPAAPGGLVAGRGAGPGRPHTGHRGELPQRELPQRELRGRIGAGQALGNALTLAWRNVAQLRHSPEMLLDVILMPIVFLVLFLFVFGGAVAGSTHAYLQELLPGLVAQMAMFATMGLGTALCDDIHKGVFDRFRSLPVARSAPRCSGTPSGSSPS